MDWRTPPPSGAFPAPAEGLPPCMKVCRLDSRCASLRDMSLCDGNHAGSTRFWILAGNVVESTPSKIHRDFTAPWHVSLDSVIRVSTDDPDEAQAAFERGAEWVRTGEMA